MARCWQVRHNSDQYDFCIGENSKFSFWMKPVFSPSPHWHMKYSHWSDDLLCQSGTKCVHAFRQCHLDSAGGLGEDTKHLDLCALRDNQLGWGSLSELDGSVPPNEGMDGDDPFSSTADPFGVEEIIK